MTNINNLFRASHGQVFEAPEIYGSSVFYFYLISDVITSLLGEVVIICCVISVHYPGSMDPYSRAPRSPKNKSLGRPQGLEGLSQNFNMDDTKSPTQEQVSVLETSND